MVKKTLRGLLSIVLAACMMMSAVVVTAAESDEEYLSELRLIYAKDYEEAKQVLADTKLQGYEILNQNLNAKTDKIGVWLAYKTTTDVNNAITDIAVMQMGGGYSLGNYQDMIRQSREQYQAMGAIYLQAIEYFMGAYDAGDFLAESAYRQLNLYNGLDKRQKARLGDLFVEATLTNTELATMFMEGNSYVLKNVRSLLAMGVSYNEDGEHYLTKVSSSAQIMNKNLMVFDDEGYDTLAANISPTVVSFRTMFEELSVYEDELNYGDEEYTDLEIKYAEYKAMAEMLRATPYLNGASLYDFCLNYTPNSLDYRNLYPLVDALNDGQNAMTSVGSFYDVVRYSMSDYPEELMDEKISELEAQYGASPVDVYAGVDRSIYKGTFALTSQAMRANAYTDSKSFEEALFGNGAWKMTTIQILSGTIGMGFSIWAISRAMDIVTPKEAVRLSAKMFENAVLKAQNEVGNMAIPKTLTVMATRYERTYQDLLYNFLRSYDSTLVNKDMTFVEMFKCLDYEMGIEGSMGMNYGVDHPVRELWSAIDTEMVCVKEDIVRNPPVVNPTSFGTNFATGVIAFAGAASLAYSAISLYNKYHEHYNPEYSEVPVSLVDLVKTTGGDRYIKYDVVYEAMPQKDKGYAPGDLNAYKGQRWNALYYTKSYEAGKPLLAEFILSNESNRAEEGYLPVHRFGEVVCYDLNKYAFSGFSAEIFLSVAQSENQKSVVANIPDIVGSVFGNGIWFLAGGIGLIAGIGATVGTQAVLKRKKKGSSLDS